MGMPNCFTSSDRAIMHPSLFDKTATGFVSRSGRKMRSQETKKLLQSISAKLTMFTHGILSDNRLE